MTWASASRALECIRSEAPPGTHDEEQSGCGAAIIGGMYDGLERDVLADELAGAFLIDGPWNAVELAERGAGCLDRWPTWMTALALRVVAVHRSRPAGRPEELVGVIEAFLNEHPAPAGESGPPRIIRLLERSARPPPTHDWPIAAIDSVGALAQRLELSDGQLAWLADVRGLERTVTDERLRNYRYRALARALGPPRVIEAPKARLKEVQRWVLHEILDRIPVHDAATGFARGRSVVEHAALHAGQDAVLRLDLRDFFASIAAARVYGIFRTAGYRPSVAHTLTGLATNIVPPAIWRQIPRTDADPRAIRAHFWLGRRLATPHLPQGAPTSPALANLAAFRLDRRLTGLAQSLGLRYSRYADDLTFSGPARVLGRSGRLQELIAAIAAGEGFVLNADKSAVRMSGSRQVVCGIVVNVHPNAIRTEYDRLRAVLHNCARRGPESQNRAGIRNFEAHLRGRVAWIASVNPARGERLERLFAQIDWSSS